MTSVFIRRISSIALSGICLAAPFAAEAKESAVKLVVNREPMVTIVMAKDAPEFSLKAAESLKTYIQKISGADVVIVNDPTKVATPGKIWVGSHPDLAKAHPDVKLDFSNPEETLIQTSGPDLILAGRDRVGANGSQLEGGTNLAVMAFIEDQLGVRWLWPGDLGTDIPKEESIQVAPMAQRYTPQLRLRWINMANAGRDYRSMNDAGRANMAKGISNPEQWVSEKDRATRQWLNNHHIDAPPTKEAVNCMAGSLGNFRARHVSYGWYERYGKEHPEYFAMQMDGTRTPYPAPPYAKLCVSHPAVADIWIKNAKAFFESNPDATTFEAAENDRGWEGYCVCENCLAMDDKNGEILERNLKWKGVEKPFYSLTDRYTKFWNQIARRLKQEFPGRDVNVSTFAYHPTRPGPSIKMEENIIPAFIGLERRFHNRNSQEHTLAQREMWRKWWEAANRRNVLIWRPNIIYKNLGLPYIFTARHAENMRFLADHGLAGIYFGNSGGHWAIQGPQLYLHAKLAWDPKKDYKQILADYYERAFGPAAPYVAQYFQLFEDLHIKLAEQYKGQIYSIYADPPRLYREARQDDQPATARLGREGVVKNRQVEEKAAALLAQAENAVANGGKIYQDRVAFLKVGFAFIQAQLDSIESGNSYVESPTPENKAKFDQAVARRDALLLSQINTPAVNAMNIWREWAGAQPKVIPAKKRQKEEKKLINDLEA